MHDEPAPRTGAAGPAPDGGLPRRRSRLARTVGGLTSVNTVVLLAALATGPIQAHALGPMGRGELAEILVPVSLAATFAEFGLGTYAMRAVAQGRTSGELLGTIGAILVLIGAVGAACSGLVATLLVGHREPVRDLLAVGLLMLPIGLLTNMVTGICAGLERWRAYSVSRLIPPVGAALGMTALLALGDLTVTTGAVLSFALGSVALLPVLIGIRGGDRLRFVPEIAREGVSFGARAWLGSLMGTANMQISQLILVAAAGPAQLGLYAVANNVASSTDMVSSSVYGAIFPRVAAGEHDLAPRACRMTLLIVGSMSLAAGLAAPFLLPLVFGPRFAGAVTIVEFLLCATVLSAASTVLGAALTALGRPGLLAYADVITIALTVPGLIVMLPWLGGVGAALVAITASASVFAFLLSACSRCSEQPAWHFVAVRTSDLRWAARLLGPRVRQIFGAVARSAPARRLMKFRPNRG